MHTLSFNSVRRSTGNLISAASRHCCQKLTLSATLIYIVLRWQRIGRMFGLQGGSSYGSKECSLDFYCLGGSHPRSPVGAVCR